MIESNGDASLLEEVLKTTKVNLNAFDMKGYTILHWAAKCGYTHCIEVLMRYGADIRLKTLVLLLISYQCVERRNGGRSRYA